MILDSAWVSEMVRARTVDVAIGLGMREQGRSPTSWCLSPCPACGAERRHSKSEPEGERGRGPIGVAKSKPHGFNCFQCAATGNTIDLVAYQLRGRRYRDLHDTERAEVRTWCQRWLRLDPSEPYTPRMRRLADAGSPPIGGLPTPSYPPLAEALDLWDQCGRVDCDAPASEYLLGRALSPGRIADLDLARALPTSDRVPEWAKRWQSSGHQLIVPLYNAKADLRSVLARSLDRQAQLKSRSPAGFQRAGLSMQCGFARYLIREATRPDWWPADTALRVMVVEGEIDYLTVATEWSDSAQFAPATIGVVQGAWSPELAARVPDGAVLQIGTHADEQGEKYAVSIFETLKGRSIEVRRWNPGAAA